MLKQQQFMISQFWRLKVWHQGVNGLVLSESSEENLWKWVEVAQSCLTLCRLYPARLLCPWDSPGKNTGVDCHFLLQGIFPIQGLNPGLLHCRQILYHLSHQGSLTTRVNPSTYFLRRYATMLNQELSILIPNSKSFIYMLFSFNQRIMKITYKRVCFWLLVFNKCHQIT